MGELQSKMMMLFKPKSLKKISDQIDEALSHFFYRLTIKVLQRPWRTILGVILCSLICGLGWLRFGVETDSVELYAPLNSQATKDREFIKSAFGESNSRGSHLYVVGTNSGENILSQQNIQFLFDINDEVHSGTNSSIIEEKQGVLAYWKWNRTIFESDENYLQTLSQDIVADCCDPSSAYINKDLVISGISYSADGVIKEVEAFHLSWFLGEKEEEQFLEIIPTLSYTGLEIYPANGAAIDAAFQEAVARDTPLVIICCILLSFYSCFVLSKYHPVKSRSYLGFIAVIGVLFAIIAGFGVVMACGTLFSLVVNAVLFVSLGLGVDDAFVIVDAVTRHQLEELPTDVIMAKGLSVAGASIFLTSLTDFVAFMVGSTTRIPALSAFAIFAGVTILVVFMIQVTFFPAIVGLDLRRQQSKRLDVLCCKKMPDSYDEAQTQDVKCCFWKVSNEPQKPLSQKVIGSWLPRIILHPIGKVLVVLIALFLLVGGGYGISQLEMEFNDEWLVSDNHFLQDAWKIRDKYFQSKYYPVPMYTKQVSGGYYQAQDQMRSLIDEVKILDYVLDVSVENNWYDSFMSWYEATASTNATSERIVAMNSEHNFISNLKVFLNSSIGQSFQSNIVFTEISGEHSSIYATSIFQTWIVDSYDNSELVRKMKHQRKVISDAASKLSPIIYQGSFPYLEGLAILYYETVRNVLIACACVFIICLFVLANLQIACMVLIILAMIDICLMGSLWWINDYLNTVTAINLLISIGLSVDYSAHIAHSFMMSDGVNRDERVRKALQHIGVSVFNGGISTFIAILPSGMAETYIFQTFVKMITLIVALGLYFGMVFLPVCLSFFGPPSYGDSKRDTSKRTSKVIVFNNEEGKSEETKSH